MSANTIDNFELIRPFLRPIEQSLADPTVTEIMVNGSGRVFIERRGTMFLLDGVAIQQKTLEVACKNIARLLGQEVSAEKPILDARLPDGSRVAVVFPPCSLGGITMTVRKFPQRIFTTDDLIESKSLTFEAAEILIAAINDRHNILISGGTGTGKTTVLNALAAHISDEQRIVIIEDTAEIKLEKPNLVRFEARRELPELKEVSMRDLLKASLRHRPDRILLGEVRGGEAFDLLQALNTGHDGTLSTIHANSTKMALKRFATCVLQSDVELPYNAIRESIADSLHILVQVERTVTGLRTVQAITAVRNYDSQLETYELETLYERLTIDDIVLSAVGGIA
jgi:pilus assembly protein CpaF